MREFPVFVPYGGEHLAAVVAVPDGDPNGLVLMTTGTGAPRSHRFQLWTRVARGLADRGVASVRLDYLGMGDSTGRVVERRMGQLGLRIEEAGAVASFAREALGVERVAGLGNCSGGLVALGVAANMPGCVGTACVLPRVLQPTSVNRMVIGLRGSKAAAVVRSHPTLWRLLGPLRGRKGKTRSAVRESMGAVLGSGRLLFVYSEKDTDAYNDESRAKIDRLLAELPADHRQRFELRVLPDGPLAGFESIEAQRRVIDTVVPWLTECFGTKAEPKRAAEAGAVTAPIA
jgi:pimeloyl-ACP methyl ester carboxylesterase